MGVVGEAAQVGDVGNRQSGAAEEGLSRVDAAFEDECWQPVPVGAESALQGAAGQTPMLCGVGECPAGSGLIGDGAANVERE